MQISAHNEINSQKKEFEQKRQQESEKQHEQMQMQVYKKKPSILKKRKLPPTKIFSNVDLKHAINIGDVCFVSEQALRDPNNSQETLLKTLYHYKMISKVTLNSSFVNIELKKNAENILPPEYFFERLRSFGDKQMANIADHLESIHNQFQVIKQSCPTTQTTFQSQSEYYLLQNFVKSMEGKMYFLYFSEITPQKINMRNVVFSIPLLKALGCNLKNIAMDFLKYKHLFFQVFTAKNYRNLVQACLYNISKIQSQLMLNPNMSEEEKKQLTSISYTDELIRTKQGTQGIYEEISQAKVVWFSPHPSICCFEILQMDQAEGIKLNKRMKTNYFRQSRPQEQLQQLRRIGLNCPLLQIEDHPNRIKSSESVEMQKKKVQTAEIGQCKQKGMNQQFKESYLKQYQN